MKVLKLEKEKDRYNQGQSSVLKKLEEEKEKVKKFEVDNPGLIDKVVNKVKFKIRAPLKVPPVVTQKLTSEPPKEQIVSEKPLEKTEEETVQEDEGDTQSMNDYKNF